MNTSLISPMDLSKEDLNQIFSLANEIMLRPNDFSNICDGKIMATLFFEPSTRTKFSFEAAMMRLGGKILGFSEPNSSSTSKGETLADTIRMVSIYSDIITIRHPMEGAAKVASMYSSVPVINAGDGAHHHPTQTLADLLTINSLKGTLEGHTIGICGDLLNGRTVSSLITAMARYKGNKFILISPRELKVPNYIKVMLDERDIEYREVENLEEVISSVDILYMTRVQKERFTDEEEYLRLKDFYILDKSKMEKAKSDMIVMHPLPRVNEINVDVDSDKRAAYFKQAEFGMYARMALIIKLLEATRNEAKNKANNEGVSDNALVCSNNKCITNQEKYIPQGFKGETLSCIYCDNIMK